METGKMPVLPLFAIQRTRNQTCPRSVPRIARREDKKSADEDGKCD